MNQEMLRKRVLFAGYYGMDNVGDDCFGAVLTWGARHYWGTEQALLLSRKEITGPVKTHPACREQRWFRGQYLLESLWQVLRASCVVWGGGSIFHSAAPRFTSKHFSMLASRLGTTPAGALGVSLGPYPSVEDEKTVRGYLSRLSFLTLRDQASYQEACSMNLPYQPVLAADLALLLPRMMPLPVRPDPEARVLGITICHYERFRGKSRENEARREKTLLDALLQMVQDGFTGTFRFFVFNAHPLKGDRKVTQEFVERLRGRGARVELVPYGPDPIAIWAQVAGCSAMISTRLHGAIYAAAANVPCCLIEYHRKCTDFISDAGVGNKWIIGDADCSSETLSDKLAELLSSAQAEFYSKRSNLIAMAEKNFTSLQ